MRDTDLTGETFAEGGEGRPEMTFRLRPYGISGGRKELGGGLEKPQTRQGDWGVENKYCSCR